MDIYIDGVLDTSALDTYSATNKTHQVLYTKSGLASGSHTIRIKLRTDKNASSNGYFTDVDAFQYSYTAYEGRDKYSQPFASNSIWNTPIGSGATFSGAPVPASAVQPPQGFGLDNGLMVFDPSGPLRQVYDADWPIVDPPQNPSAKNLYWPIGDSTIFKPGDGSWDGDTPNNMGGLVLKDGRTIQEYNYMGRFTNGGPIYVAGDGVRSTLDIYGSGQSTDYLGHGGSGLTGFGGNIRKGELTSPESNRIRHVLEVTIDCVRWCGQTGGVNKYRWPAIAADTGPDDTYGLFASGYTPFLGMGSLLAIPSDTVLNTLLASLETEPAKKLAWTMRYYGAYISDTGGHNSGWGQNLWNVEYGVSKEMRDIGIDLVTYADEGGHADTAWNRDMVKLFTQLREVTNNSPTSIGGGGVPLQPLAPAITN